MTELVTVHAPLRACAWSPTLGWLSADEQALDMLVNGETLYSVSDDDETVELPEPLALLALRDRTLLAQQRQIAALTSTLTAHMERGDVHDLRRRTRS